MLLPALWLEGGQSDTMTEPLINDAEIVPSSIRLPKKPLFRLSSKFYPPTQPPVGSGCIRQGGLSNRPGRTLRQICP